MGIMKKFFNNTRKPEGFFGKIMLSSMNRHHSGVSLWGIEHILENDFHSVLDIGCGGGMNIKRFLKKYPNAAVTGVDYSDVSVFKTRKVNYKDFINGRLEVVNSDVSDMPFDDKSFDLVSAFETVYFWPGPLKSFQEVYRVLEDGGCFLIVNEIERLTAKSEKWKDIIDGMEIYTEQMLRNFLTEAGFSQIKADIKEDWICIVAVK